MNVTTPVRIVFNSWHSVSRSFRRFRRTCIQAVPFPYTQNKTKQKAILQKNKNNSKMCLRPNVFVFFECYILGFVNFDGTLRDEVEGVVASGACTRLQNKHKRKQIKNWKHFYDFVISEFFLLMIFVFYSDLFLCTLVFVWLLYSKYLWVVGCFHLKR